MPTRLPKVIGSLIAIACLVFMDLFDSPLEEFLFFIIVPMAAILTIEGVTTVKPHLREKEFGKDEVK